MNPKKVHDKGSHRKRAVADVDRALAAIKTRRRTRKSHANSAALMTKLDRLGAAGSIKGGHRGKAS
jgi:hypothetical protein